MTIANTQPNATVGVLPATRSYAWTLVALLSLAYLFSTLDRYLLGVALEPIRRDLALSDTQLGLLVGPAFAISYALFCPILGRLADVTNRCRVIAGGLLVWSLSTAAIAFSGSFGWLLGARAMVGMGEAALAPAATSLIAAYFVREELGRATSVFMSGAAFGKACAFIGGGALLGVLSAAGGMQLGWSFSAWQALFILAAIPGALLGCVFFVYRDPQRARDREKRAPHAPLSVFLKHVSTRKHAYAFHILASTILALSNNVFMAWSPSFYVRQFGLEPSIAAMLAGIATALTGLAGFWAGGVAMDALRRRGVPSAPSWIIAAALAVVVVGVGIFALAGNLWISLLGYALTQFAIQSPSAATLAGVQLLTPPAYRGFAIGSYLVILQLGAMALGPALVGLVNDELYAGGNLGASIFTVVAGFGTIGLALSLGNTKAYSRAAVD